ncbi:hypothetical protein [Thalassolituus oleivorans]|uniref:Uncharacterized protein n=1 Tax=Thalassolituus oleivorans MIL-1 TaxID=1298593 RepID=M5DVC0_9GAMM|nr:hypothetical protein [Thalassolituus oleivorans]CCU73213.1 hypothetical protein TOL_2817 [Thalassolituus oleivorans MIL-1]
MRILSFIIAIFIGTTANAEILTVNYEGEAYSLDDKVLLYREVHTLIIDNDMPISREVDYIDPDGKVIAHKTSTYKGTPTTPDFELTDFRDGYQESAETDNKKRILSVKENTDSPVSIKSLDKPEYTTVVDAGFDEFVREQWQGLLAGKTESFSFAAPARLEYIDFRLIPINQDDTTLTVEMRLKSRWIAWLLDPIQLTYDLTSQRLLRYKGLTNLRDDQGNGIKAEIVYRYP